MKKFLVVSAVVVVALAVFGFAGLAYAQSQTPQPVGPGMMGGRAGSYGRSGEFGAGRSMMGARGGGLLHDYLVNAMAEAFDLSAEDLQAQLDAGDTMWTIAQSKGMTQDAFYTLMKDVRTQAIAQAVADGVITQEQADWMLQRMQQLGANGGFGACNGGGAMGGRGR